MSGRVTAGKPSVVWLEGVLDYFNTPFPHGPDDPRRIGFGVGRQIVGLYLAEMLLKYALDHMNEPYEKGRDFLGLYSALPERGRSAVEAKYADILSSEAVDVFDFASTVESYLRYLGDDALTDSRYFWERERPHDASIVFMENDLRRLVYSLFIVLHNYPEAGPLEKRYDTKIIQFEDSLDNKEHPPEHKKERDGKRITPSIFWLEGVLNYFNVPFPRESDDPRSLGFQVGQRIVGLYLVEMLLKYALDDMDRAFGSNHNLYSLYKKLPRPRRRAVSRVYDKILHNRVSSTWNYAQSAEILLEYSGDDALTDTRYFWERKRSSIPLSPSPLMPLIYALFIELHDYPQRGPMTRRHETAFLPFRDAS